MRGPHAACGRSRDAGGMGVTTADHHLSERDSAVPRLHELLTEAKDFLRLRCDETGEAPCDARIRSIADEIERTATYRHDFAELEYGCRLAWRNSLDCLGKGMWRRLEVRDRREERSPGEMFDACIDHLHSATRDGRTKTMITVFRPAASDDAGARILNKQLVAYAGYRRGDGSVVGDPANTEFTEAVQRLGWVGDHTPFDVLPIVIKAAGERPRWFPVPREAVLEIPLCHPDLPWFGGLGLRWYSHPTISDRQLRIGGVSYPAVPFSGWYTCSEIAMLNLGGATRYNVLPRIAEQLGLSTVAGDRFWRDRALAELRRAVLYSFTERRVTIVDDHTAAAAFARHHRRESACGRTTSARRASLTNAVADSVHHLFEREYDESVNLPNFFNQPTDGM